MKVKGSVKIDLWYDPKINFYCAAFRDTYGNVILGDIELAKTKTAVLKKLTANKPEFEFEKKKMLELNENS